MDTGALGSISHFPGKPLPLNSAACLYLSICWRCPILSVPPLRPKLQCSRVSKSTQPHDDTGGLVAEVAVAAPGFAGVDVGHVDFDKWEAGGQQGVADGDARVRVRGWVDDDGDSVSWSCRVRSRVRCRW